MKMPKLTEVFQIKEDLATDPESSPDPFQDVQRQSRIQADADGNLLVSAETGRPGSFTMTTGDFDQVVKQLKANKQVSVKVLPRGAPPGKKPIAVLNTKDVQSAFFTGKTPTLQQHGHDKKAGSKSGGEYWIVNIPKSALGKV